MVDAHRAERKTFINYNRVENETCMYPNVWK